MDFLIIDYSIKNNIPLFGICRGIQVINVYFNGTLHQDINNHKNIKENHIINFTNNKNPFFNVFLNNTLLVNSYHHQAINKLGDNINALAIHHKDNIIEMINHNTYPIIGIQWHLEILNTYSSDIIFKHFLK